MRFAIIGQGIAGTMVAWRLHKIGHDFVVIDNGFEHSASYIAGGLINPIMGRNFSLTWEHKLFYSYLMECYQEIEKTLNISFFEPSPITRLIPTNSELHNFELKAKNQISDFISKIHIEPNYQGINPISASADLLFSGQVNTSVLLSKFRDFLASQNKIIVAPFDYSKLRKNNSQIHHPDFQADYFILCTGHQESTSNLFDFLPFNTVKGEELTLEIPDLPQQCFTAKGYYIVPRGNNIFKFGSTYEWTDKTTSITNEARLELEEGYKSIYIADYKIIKQEAGIRPATKNRRPFVGVHPLYKNAFILNGLGTRGITLAPLLSKKLINFILEGKDIFDETNIKHYWKVG